ncbi:hypothetical protein TWF481_010975 [Arthrobotrys musiformis]|uniref:Peptidase A1 domain-containing protein n=1 Tax=Arthrobotrys musiformis TaxID=47236 RepID=A0AAV9W317_9PEZI
MGHLISVVAFLIFVTYASADSELPSFCFKQPWPVVVKFGLLNLGSTGRLQDPPIPTGYGLQVTLGGEKFTPRVEILESQNVWVSEVRLTCNSTRPKDCRLGPSYHPNTEILAGGVYSRHQVQDSTNTSIQSTAKGVDILGNETLSIGGRVLNGFEFQSNRDQLSPSTRGLGTLVSSYIGLGTGSTLINRLYNQGMISTRAWSFFPGWIGTDSWFNLVREGVLIIGGYDANLTAGGEFQEFPIPQFGQGRDPSCPFPIEVSGVKWFGKDAIDSSIPERQPFTACVNPGTNLFEFPYGIWETLAGFGDNTPLAAYRNVSGTLEQVNKILPVEQQGLEYSNFQSNVDRVTTTSNFDLSMIIKLKSGLEITIPSTQIFQRKRLISDATNSIQTYGVSNGSDSDIRTAVLTYPSTNRTHAKPNFGIPFLTSAYFMANYDTNKFGLAPIKASDLSQGRDIKIFPPPQCIPSGERALSARVVAPIVIGIFALLCLLTLLWVYRAQRRYAISLSRGLGSKDTLSTIQEMDATERFEHEIDSKSIYELPVHRGRTRSPRSRSRSIKSKRSYYELP